MRMRTLLGGGLVLAILMQQGCVPSKEVPSRPAQPPSTQTPMPFPPVAPEASRVKKCRPACTQDRDCFPDPDVFTSGLRCVDSGCRSVDPPCATDADCIASMNSLAPCTADAQCPDRTGVSEVLKFACVSLHGKGFCAGKSDSCPARYALTLPRVGASGEIRVCIPGYQTQKCGPDQKCFYGCDSDAHCVASGDFPRCDQATSRCVCTPDSCARKGSACLPEGLCGCTQESCTREFQGILGDDSVSPLGTCRADGHCAPDSDSLCARILASYPKLTPSGSCACTKDSCGPNRECIQGECSCTSEQACTVEAAADPSTRFVCR